MKRILLIIIMSVTSINLYSQNLTLAQILEIKNKSLGNAEEYLTTKGWDFLQAKEAGENLGYATFTYNKSDTSDNAESFLNFYYSSYSNKTRISIQIGKKTKYTEYINAIKGYGCELISSKVEDGKIIKIYRGKTTTFDISSSTSKNYYNVETAIWTIFITSNDDYDLNWGDE